MVSTCDRAKSCLAAAFSLPTRSKGAVFVGVNVCLFVCLLVCVYVCVCHWAVSCMLTVMKVRVVHHYFPGMATPAFLY